MTDQDQKPPVPRRALICLLLPVIFFASCTARPAATADDLTLPLTDCTLRSPGFNNQVDARCGSLAVPENPSDPQSRQLDLHIAVVEAISRRSEPDPVFILVGGPGQSAVETYPALAGTLITIHQSRDIVLVDQRGTGKSNPLRCLDPQEAETVDEEQALARLKACPEELDADLRFYTTDIAMQDLDRVRSALGYESINLYGVSYGTRAALVYLKMYPGRVRSMVLDAVVDPGFVLYQEAARDGERSLELFFDRCEADAACSSTYPRLRAEFNEIVDELAAGPAEITIPHPLTGEPFEVVLSKSTFANMVFNTLYAPDLVATLPLAIHQAYSADNYAPLITQSSLLSAGIYDGMFYAVACIEDAPFVTSVEDSESLFESSAQRFVEICNAWPHRAAPEIVQEPVASDVPVLLLSGEADPITPPRHAADLAESLSNSLHLVFGGMGHGNASTDCTRRIVDRFVETASVTDLDTTCVQGVEPPPFFVDFSGPQP